MQKVIKGIDEGIRGMRVNGIRRLSIPPKLAYVEGVDDDKPGPIPNGSFIIHMFLYHTYTLSYLWFYIDYGPRRQILTRADRFPKIIMLSLVSINAILIFREVWNFEIKILKIK